MDIVLGVSMTPTTVRLVLVEGEKADGLTVDHDVFDVTNEPGSATSSAPSQVIDAVLGTKESAETGGHHLKAIGVTWSDHTEASALRDGLAARGIDDVMLVSDGHAAAALAQAVGRAVGYDTTALFFIDRDTATLSVVQTDDGSVVKVLSRTLHSGDAMAVLAEMAAAVDAQESRPQAMFVVGSGVDIASVKNHLENLVSLPVSAPDEPDLAAARGAALAAANAPAFEASTVGLAYSQDPDGPTAGSAYAALAGAQTQMAPFDGADPFSDDEPQTEIQLAGEERKPFLLVGSALTSIFVIGVVALVISLAVSIRPTADQRPSPGQSAIVPSTIAPAPPPPVRQEAQPVEAPPPPPPPAETIKAPIPVVQEAPQAPPRTVYVEAPAAPAPAPAPAAPPPPPPAAPAPAPVAPAPVPAPVYIPPPVYEPPAVWYPRPRNPWLPPWRPAPPSYDPPTPTWTPPKPWNPPWEEPDEPQSPQWPPWENGSGSGSGSSSGSRGSDDYGPGSRRSGGSGGSQGPSGRGGSGGSGGNCFLIFCS
ncbi:hypothetical protein H7I53_06315 [Mycolicibacterium pulveris]|uniref:DUF7159 domain-containing protein n=1 Tax=Mycolicibacterium pulveris TaxID=36813 RepID=A0A7I7UJ31_MYCPV|nr:hypothetical protein [Mycolicibacterium pulveris]MCV6979841.1 hypothetical protein [Mycolicibacterium pulveris]BBY80709.1 hypothetical protein MPUL_18670 [Mycolicibacterium pulveris]